MQIRLTCGDEKCNCRSSKSEGKIKRGLFPRCEKTGRIRCVILEKEPSCITVMCPTLGCDCEEEICEEEIFYYHLPTCEKSGKKKYIKQGEDRKEKKFEVISIQSGRGFWRYKVPNEDIVSAPCANHGYGSFLEEGDN